MFLNFTELIYLAWHWIARRHRKLRDRQRMAKLQEGNIMYLKMILKYMFPTQLSKINRAYINLYI